jgi:hypothetical protein
MKQPISESPNAKPGDAQAEDTRLYAAHSGDGMLDAAGDTPAVPLFRERGPLAEFIIAVCGLTALATPLILWVSWTQEIFMTALVVGLVCIAVCWAVVTFADGD